MENDMNAWGPVPDRDGPTRAGPGLDLVGAQLDLAKGAASEAGRLVVEMRRCPNGEIVWTKRRQDFVVESGIAAKSLNRKEIAGSCPGEPLLSERNNLNPWDAMAGILLFREAGGHADLPGVDRFRQCGGRRPKC